MNKFSLTLTLVICLIFNTLQAQITDPVATEVWTLVPKVVRPSTASSAPSDKTFCDL